MNKLKGVKISKVIEKIDELQGIDKVMIRCFKKSYNEGIKSCLKSIEENLSYCLEKNGTNECKNCGLNREQLKMLLMKLK